jgi:DNA-binding LacI/PurR family transcriptional regulator
MNSDSLSTQESPAHVCKTPVALRPPSIKDIARLARVSHSTVSRALQNSPLVNSDTAQRIRQIARDSGYRASAVARGLVMRKTLTVGVVVTTIADPFVSEVVGGIEDFANDHGYSVFFANSHADPEREKRVAQAFAERRVDGILVTSSRVGSLYVPLLSELRVPIVLINNQHPTSLTHAVVIENVEAGRAATEHLIGLGHRRIAYLGDRFGYASETERFTGYRQALEHAGLPFHPELVVHGDGKPEAAVPATESLLALPQRPTALFCYNDMSALGAFRAIRAAGLRVPHDISVVGFDDLFIASYTDPPLTTLRQPMHQMGRTAMECLLKLMSAHQPPETIRVPAQLIVRESTAAPREAN